LLYGKPLAASIWRTFLGVVVIFLGGSRAGGQEFYVQPPCDLLQQPVAGRDLMAALWAPAPAFDDAPARGQAARFRQFRMLPGFMADPFGLESDDDPVVVGDPAAIPPARDTDNFGRIQVTLGNDNPYFDFRWRGDPGGVGYYKVNSQMQLLDSGTTSICFNCLAVTPAGLEAGGVADGPTIITPGVGLFQELGWGTALQGYVGSNFRTASHWGDRLEGAYHYGMSWQCPLPGLVNSDKTGVYMFMQALGRYRYEGESQTGRPATWEFVPGIHWRIADSCWMSLGGMRSSLLTCSWRF
jgi:hypothetical protein